MMMLLPRAVTEATLVGMVVTLLLMPATMLLLLEDDAAK
jgi:hypothetical protein